MSKLDSVLDKTTHFYVTYRHTQTQKYTCSVYWKREILRVYITQACIHFLLLFLIFFPAIILSLMIFIFLQVQIQNFPMDFAVDYYFSESSSSSFSTQATFKSDTISFEKFNNNFSFHFKAKQYPKCIAPESFEKNNYNYYFYCKYAC